MSGIISTPEDQAVEIEQENEHGENVATINVDMRSERTTKLMDNFLQLPENTLVGVLVGVTILIVIALIGYAFTKCWCKKLHQICGVDNMDIEMNERINGQEEAANPGLVFKGEAKTGRT